MLIIFWGVFLWRQPECRVGTWHPAGHVSTWHAACYAMAFDGRSVRTFDWQVISSRALSPPEGPYFIPLGHFPLGGWVYSLHYHYCRLSLFAIVPSMCSVYRNYSLGLKLLYPFICFHSSGGIQNSSETDTFPRPPANTTMCIIVLQTPPNGWTYCPPATLTFTWTKSRLAWWYKLLYKP